MTSTPRKTSDISAIVPTLNETHNIDRLADMLDGHVGEVILVDGGSTDNTREKGRSRGFRVSKNSTGRAGQMNGGSTQANGSVLLFLHADSRLPAGFAELIIETLADEKTSLCAFSLAIETSNPLLTGIAALANVRSRLFGLPYGDQSFSLRKETFKALGGFPALPIMEDYELARRAARHGNVITLNAQLVTSDRRWRKLGIVQTTLINQLVIIGFKCGVSPEKLALLYRRGLFGDN